MISQKLPSQQTLQAMFSYSVVTGNLYRKNRLNCKTKSLKTVGWINKSGHLRIEFFGQKFMVHRIIWQLVTGEDPGELQVDHVDGNPVNNAWHNLRLVTNQENTHNSKISILNTSGFKGVGWRKSHQKWTARITVDSRCRFLGYFDTPEDAHRAYLKAKQLLHPTTPSHHFDRDRRSTADA